MQFGRGGQDVRLASDLTGWKMDDNSNSFTLSIPRFRL